MIIAPRRGPKSLAVEWAPVINKRDPHERRRAERRPVAPGQVFRNSSATPSPRARPSGARARRARPRKRSARDVDASILSLTSGGAPSNAKNERSSLRSQSPGRALLASSAARCVSDVVRRVTVVGAVHRARGRRRARSPGRRRCRGATTIHRPRRRVPTRRRRPRPRSRPTRAAFHGVGVLQDTDVRDHEGLVVVPLHIRNRAARDAAHRHPDAHIEPLPRVDARARRAP